MTNFVLTNAILVLPDEVIDGHVAVDDGGITGIGAGGYQGAGAIDCEGDYILPGLVELHTDHLETHYLPRPGVRWPAMPAALAHDAQIVAAGITTVFDAVCVGSPFGDDRRGADDTAAQVDAISEGEARGLFRAEHHLHLRCEIVADDVVPAVEHHLEHSDVRLMSLMDHTPGQRQFVNVDKFREYYVGKGGMTMDEVERFIEERVAQQIRVAHCHRRTVVDLARTHSVPLASHDDATPMHVDEAIEDGAVISEFPTTFEAATRAHGNGLSVLMGGPNVVRGGSHSGNVSAIGLAESGHLDILSSDYVPASLLMAVFKLAGDVPTMTLPEAVATVTETPARAVGLTDRGALRQGLRADLIRVRAEDRDALVSVQGAWREGRQIF
ncbi:MAG: alpha-D-ribose 1-methylphosphonate 5-triphosphate diphosphatase [Pseudomonadota bacterium]